MYLLPTNSLEASVPILYINLSLYKAIKITVLITSVFKFVCVIYLSSFISTWANSSVLLTTPISIDTILLYCHHVMEKRKAVSHFSVPQNDSVGPLSIHRPKRDILCAILAVSTIRLNSFDVY